MTDNPAEAARMYTDAMQAQLGERVTNINRRQNDLEQEVRSGFRSIEQSFSAFSSETRAAISSLSQTLADRNKPQWQAIGVALTFAVVIGGMAYWPIREATSSLRGDLSQVSQNAMSVAAFQDFKATYENNRVVSRGDYIDRFARVDSEVKSIEAQVVPRGEHEEKWRGNEQRIADVQRQIDDLKEALGGIYGARDVILDLRERLDRIEQQERARAGSSLGYSAGRGG